MEQGKAFYSDCSEPVSRAPPTLLVIKPTVRDVVAGTTCTSSSTNRPHSRLDSNSIICQTAATRGRDSDCAGDRHRATSVAGGQTQAKKGLTGFGQPQQLKTVQVNCDCQIWGCGCIASVNLAQSGKRGAVCQWGTQCGFEHGGVSVHHSVSVCARGKVNSECCPAAL